MSHKLSITILTGRDAGLRDHIPDLARLRIAVFREFPYLYDGAPAYEEKYLATYVECADSVVVLAHDGESVVGASTGLPLSAETDEFKKPFIAAGVDPARVFYCGESVLLPGYRGRGVYRDFFQGREAHARALGGFDCMAFCAVVRADTHPRRPANYVPLDAIWQKFGYAKQSQLTATFTWKDIDAAEPATKEMVFWLKPLLPE